MHKGCLRDVFSELVFGFIQKYQEKYVQTADRYLRCYYNLFSEGGTLFLE